MYNLYLYEKPQDDHPIVIVNADHAYVTLQNIGLVPADLDLTQPAVIDILWQLGYELCQEERPHGQGRQYRADCNYALQRVNAVATEAQQVIDARRQDKNVTQMIEQGHFERAEQARQDQERQAILESQHQDLVKHFMQRANLMLPAALHEHHTFGGFWQDEGDMPVETPRSSHMNAWSDLRIPNLAPIRLWWDTNLPWHDVSNQAPYVSGIVDGQRWVTVYRYQPNDGASVLEPTMRCEHYASLETALSVAAEIGETYQAALHQTQQNALLQPDSTLRTNAPLWKVNLDQELVETYRAIEAVLGVTTDPLTNATALQAKASLLVAIANWLIE